MKRELYVLEDSKLVRKRRFCPRCGPGVFLAEHADRFTCGRCGYTEIKKEPKAQEQKPKESKPRAKKEKAPAKKEAEKKVEEKKE
jgi:small subunit ribosomal protein S27Ae